MAKNYEYKKATIADIDELVRTRIIVLRTANKLSNDVDMSLVEKESYEYYKNALETGEHIAYLVYDNETFIGAGGVSFYQVMPTYHNPTGKKAYIMNILTKAGIIIQSQTGLRINEVLSIQEGCVQRTSDDYDYMEVTLGKTEKGEPIIHKVFINDIVKDAIAELSEYTAELRKESGLKELFLCKSAKKGNAINVYSLEHWNDQKLSPFINKYDIRDNKGELYPLTSHQFRATFVRELIKRKVPIAMIMKQYSHVSIEMTAHYLTLQEEEVKEIYSDMILSPESKIAGLRAKEIKGKLDDLFHGKTEDEIDEVITGLAKTMSFNPLPTGVCLYDFRRGNCTDGEGCFFYNCPNYITEVQFYPILKDELDLLEKEMARLKELGHEREWQKQYIKYKYLKPLVESLEVQLNGKESVG